MKINYRNIAEFPKKIGENLVYHNKNSSFNQILEILPPYLITFENSIPKNEYVQFLNITPIKSSEIILEYKFLNGIKIPMHSHNMIEIIFILSGNMKQYIEDKEYNYSIGDCCIINKNIRHQEHFSNDFCALFIDISEDFYYKIIQNDCSFKSNRSKYLNKRKIYKLIEKDNLKTDWSKRIFFYYKPINKEDIKIKVIPSLDSIMLETIKKEPGYLMVVLGLFTRFFSLLDNEDIYKFEQYELNLSSHEKIFSEVSHLLESTKGKISRKELEEKINYNSEYINRVVKKFSGMTLLNYTKIFILAEARYLLENTDINILEIAEKLGFKNRNYFNKVFKDKYGISPSEMRTSKCMNETSEDYVSLEYRYEVALNESNFSWEKLIKYPDK